MSGEPDPPFLEHNSCLQTPSYSCENLLVSYNAIIVVKSYFQCEKKNIYIVYLFHCPSGNEKAKRGVTPVIQRKVKAQLAVLREKLSFNSQF